MNLHTDQIGPSEQACLLNASAKCNRIWVSQGNGLRLAHIQTLGKEDPISKEGEAAVGVGPGKISDFAAYEQCARGCIGPKL
jgi:hypothetical protein